MYNKKAKYARLIRPNKIPTGLRLISSNHIISFVWWTPVMPLSWNYIIYFFSTRPPSSPPPPFGGYYFYVWFRILKSFCAAARDPVVKIAGMPFRCVFDMAVSRYANDIYRCKDAEGFSDWLVELNDICLGWNECELYIISVFEQLFVLFICGRLWRHLCVNRISYLW